MDVSSTHGDVPGWHQPDVDTFWEWALLCAFAVLFAFWVLFTVMFPMTGMSAGTAKFLVGETIISIVAVFFLVWFLIERDENRLKKDSYMLRSSGPPDQVIERTLEVLELLDLPYSQGYGRRVKPIYSRLYKVNVFSYDVDLAKYRILIEHHPAKGTVLEKDATCLRVGPSNQENQPRVLQFIEAFNALTDEGARPKLVVWTDRSRCPPANAGEGFNSSGTLTSDAEEEAR